MPRFKYAVTLESRSNPPVTMRGEVEASKAQAGCRLAAKAALPQAKGKRWSSLVVLLEKDDE
jgi:hypothetical protein